MKDDTDVAVSRILLCATKRGRNYTYLSTWLIIRSKAIIKVNGLGEAPDSVEQTFRALTNAGNMCSPRLAVRSAAHGVDEGAKRSQGVRAARGHAHAVCQFATHQGCGCFVMKPDTSAVRAWSRDPSEWRKPGIPT